MLYRLAKKICPFVTLTLATIGCGKQITEEASENARIIENQEIPSSLVVEINTNEGLMKLQQIPRNGNVIMPEVIYATNSESTYRMVTLTYNYELDSGKFDYECLYESKNSTLELVLKNCKDYFGEMITSATDFEFPIYYTKNIKMELKTPSSNNTFKAIFFVDWK